MASVPASGQRPRSGTFANGVDFLTFDGGPKTLLLIPGFPASAFRKGMRRRMSGRMVGPWLDAGFTVWMCDRRRHMPSGHTVADMAGDYAWLISEELGGRVDLVVAEDFGGMVAQYLAAYHPGCLGHLALTVTAAEMSAWGKEVDLRMAAALARGDRAGGAAVFAESLVPGPPRGWLRRPMGAVIGRVLLRADYVPGDILVEAQAQAAFDSRAALPRIEAPVLLACGDQDRFFPEEVVEETAKLIPDCTLIWYHGGLLRAASNKQIPHDVLAFVREGQGVDRPRHDEARPPTMSTTGADQTGFDTHAGTRGIRLTSGPFDRWLDGMMAKRIIRKTFSRFFRFDALNLTTIGRRSGSERMTTVCWFPGKDGTWLIVAAAGGTAANPAWYYNIAAHPDRVQIEIDGRTVAVTAEQLHGAERAQAWQQITAAAHRFARFQEKTDRELPVIRLRPAPSAAQQD